MLSKRKNNGKWCICILYIILVLLLSIYLCNRNNVLLYNSIINEKVSIDQKYKAVKFTRNIGATTRLSYQISIIRYNENLTDSPGNIYISYDDFDYEWLDGDLIIKNNVNDRVFKRENKHKQIDIFYYTQ